MTPELASRYQRLYRMVSVIKPELEVPSPDVLEAEEGDMSDVYLVLGDIGRRIGETRNPLKDKQLRELFRLVEFELAGPDSEFANAVATSLLESVFEASRGSGFSFDSVDSFVGPHARSYLHSWAEFHSLSIEGLSRH